MISLAGDRPCLNGGVCTDAIGHPICACPAPLASNDAGDVCSDDCPALNPCLNGGVCTDGIGSFTCGCAPGFCGPTCADPSDPSQNGGRCCEDDQTWVDAHDPDGGGYPCSTFLAYPSECPNYADAAGVTAAVACPVSCQSGCALTYDDCCALLTINHCFCPHVCGLRCRYIVSLFSDCLTLTLHWHDIVCHSPLIFLTLPHTSPYIRTECCDISCVRRE